MKNIICFVVVLGVVHITVFAGDQAFFDSLKSSQNNTQLVPKKSKSSQSFFNALQASQGSDSTTVGPAKTASGSQSSPTNLQSFLTSLSNNQRNQQQVAKQQQLALQQKLQQQRQQEIQDLNFIQNYYGNPDYQAAMAILNDVSLQEQYQQGLNQIDFSFFEYTQKVLSQYHTSQKTTSTNAANSAQSAASFFNSLKNQSIAPVSKTSPSQASVNPQPSTSNVVLSQGASGSNASFFNSLKQSTQKSGSNSTNSNSQEAFFNSLKGK